MVNVKISLLPNMNKKKLFNNIKLKFPYEIHENIGHPEKYYCITTCDCKMKNTNIEFLTGKTKQILTMYNHVLFVIGDIYDI